jgi:hypothetical protein
VTPDLVPQQLHCELARAAIERGAVNEQAGRLVDRAQVFVAMDDDEWLSC